MHSHAARLQPDAGLAGCAHAGRSRRYGLGHTVQGRASGTPDIRGSAPETLCAAARAVGARRRPAALTAEQREAYIKEATESHLPAADRPAPDRHGVIHMPSQQCTAYTKTGAACKRRTLRGHHCRDHMRILQRLAIAPASNPAAGHSLYLAKYKGAKPIRIGEDIVPYTGDWVPLVPGSDDHGGQYFLEIYKKLGVDAARTNTALGRWANDPKGFKDAQGRSRRANAQLRIDKKRRQGKLTACRTIQPGDEIFVSYTDDYWRPYGGALAAILVSTLRSEAKSDLLGELRAAALVDPAYQAVLTSADLGSLVQREGLLYDGDRVIVPMTRGYAPDC